jgi:ribonuclease P protein component
MTRLADAEGAGTPAERSERPGRGLSRAQRLTRSRDVKAVFDHGRRIVGAYVVLWVRSDPGAGRRVAVVASKRTFRRAVDRNRARRLMREAFRLSRERLAANIDAVLVGRRRLLDVKRQAVERDLRYVCRKAGVWEDGERP